MEEATRDAGPRAGCRRALVLGGNGFIGFHVVAALVAAGHRVVCVNRGNRYWTDAEPRVGYDVPGGGEEPPVVSVVRCDRKNRAAFERAVDAATSSLCPSGGGSDPGVDGDGAVTMEVDGVDRKEHDGEEQEHWWDVVVDLSGITPGDLRAALRGLKGRTRTYVYISSDSVYEVSVGDSSGPVSDMSASVESSAVRPADVSVATRLARDDRYGHHKLRCEEILEAAGRCRSERRRPEGPPDLSSDSSGSESASGMSWSGSPEESDTDTSGEEGDTGGDDDDDGGRVGGGGDAGAVDDGVDDEDLVPVRWVALRLPDVIGPRDSTNRLWRYQLWTQCGDVLGPVAVEPALSRAGMRRLSFVYAPDVARAVLAVARGGAAGGGSVSGAGGEAPSEMKGGRAYNIACRERVSLEELVELIADVDVVRETAHRSGAPVVVIDDDHHRLHARKRRRSSQSFEEAATAAAVEDNETVRLELHRSERLSLQCHARRKPPSFLPSVDRGPVDTTRALRELDWEPTPLATAVRETVRWFHAAAAARSGGGRHPHEEECREVARELRRAFGLRPGSHAAVALQKRLTELGFPSPRR